ncbi:response regulator transcription factor [Kineococcus aurantiacus]|uniref:DNA-binding NarL/FixJ family response regulator n=1 Tax=Kineococcus aurantiacus TaxID=37633 RepID=A0A7Y9DKX7_9ACTN|nr:helix-turn-helix transcriptional regulator [Kineococcus aurantiacus]NYD22504.1 DNA-binding NarL/FixJ family response regulator [Kineococcus aurantiacus]
MERDDVAIVDGDSVRVRTDWWGDVLRTVAEGERRVIVEDETGNRFVLVAEDRYRALEDAERSRTPGRPDVTLTAREQEVLQLVADGCPGSVVAERLGLAANTVAQHLAAVRRKYGVRSSAAAASLARQDGLIT